MKPLSDQTTALLQQLASGQGILARLTGSEAKRIHLIEQVAGCREVAAAVGLIGLLFDGSAAVAQSAAGAIHRLLAAAIEADLLALDEQLRRRDTWAAPMGWKHLRPEDLPGLPGTEQSRPSVLGMASFHPNGHVRERAVRLLSGGGDEASLPFLLIRLNDWVANVREAARESVERRLREGPIEHFVHILGLVLRLGRCGRDDHADIVQAVVSRLVDPRQAAALSEVICFRDRTVARHCFQVAAATPGAPLSHLVEAALQAEDAVLRLWATRRLPEVASGAALEEALQALQSDCSMPVRRQALTVRLEIFPQTAVAPLEEALFDPNPALREFSRFHLSRLGRQDIAACYREALSGGRHRAAAIAGLGETGARPDAALLLPFLTSPERSERQAAVRAVGRLAGDEHLEILVERLTDDGPKVCREAQQALQSQAGLLDPGRLWTIFTTDQRLRVRLAALLVLDKVGTWRKMPYLIRAASEREKGLALQARRLIEWQYNRVFTRPTAEEERGIRSTLEECAGSLSPTFVERLRCHLGW
jgi:HEAT repeat protein